jgi:hypothetical protein
MSSSLCTNRNFSRLKVSKTAPCIYNRRNVIEIKAGEEVEWLHTPGTLNNCRARTVQASSWSECVCHALKMVAPGYVPPVWSHNFCTASIKSCTQSWKHESLISILYAYYLESVPILVTLGFRHQKPRRLLAAAYITALRFSRSAACFRLSSLNPRIP